MPIVKSTRIVQEESIKLIAGLEKLISCQYKEAQKLLKSSASYQTVEDPDTSFLRAYALVMNLLLQKRESMVHQIYNASHSSFLEFLSVLVNLQNKELITQNQKLILEKAKKIVRNSIKINPFNKLYLIAMKKIPEQIKLLCKRLDQFQRQIGRTSQNYKQFIGECLKQIEIDEQKQKNPNLLNICPSVWENHIKFFEDRGNLWKVANIYKRFFVSYSFTQVETHKLVFPLQIKYSRALLNLGQIKEAIQIASLQENQSDSPYKAQNQCHLAMYKYLLYEKGTAALEKQKKQEIFSHIETALKLKDYSLSVGIIADMFRQLLKDDNLFSPFSEKHSEPDQQLYFMMKSMYEPYRNLNSKVVEEQCHQLLAQNQKQQVKEQRQQLNNQNENKKKAEEDENLQNSRMQIREQKIQKMRADKINQLQQYLSAEKSFQSYMYRYIDLQRSVPVFNYLLEIPFHEAIIFLNYTKILILSVRVKAEVLSLVLESKQNASYKQQLMKNFTSPWFFPKNEQNSIQTLFSYLLKYLFAGRSICKQIEKQINILLKAKTLQLQNLIKSFQNFLEKNDLIKFQMLLKELYELQNVQKQGKCLKKQQQMILTQNKPTEQEQMIS